MREVTRILIKSLELMKGGHWVSGSLHSANDNGETYCAMGAISKAAEGTPRNVGTGNKPADEAARILASVIRVPGGKRWCGDVDEQIANWNDEREQEDGFRTIKRGFCRAIRKSMEPAPRKKVKKAA